MALLSGCGLSELKLRKDVLQKLVATNAPLSGVEARIGHVRFIGGTPRSGMLSVRPTLATLIPKSKRILQKIEKSAAVGFTSTISMQTYIFLNEQDKLIDFEVDAQ